MIAVSFLGVQLSSGTSFSQRKVFAASLLSFFPLASCGRMTVGEVCGGGGTIKERLRSGSAERVLPSESLYGEEGGFGEG